MTGGCADETETAGPTATAVPPTSSAPATSEPTPTPSIDGPTASPDASDLLTLRPDGIGPLTLGMTREELEGTGLARVTEVDGLPVVEVGGGLRGVDPIWRESEDKLVAVVLLQGTPVRTPEGIGPDSTVADLQAAYGTRLQPKTNEMSETWYVLPEGDEGYVFFPTAEGGLIVAAGTSDLIGSVVPGSEFG